MPSSVWMVERNNHPDYAVVGVFSSRENAQQLADAINAPHAHDDRYDRGKAIVAEWPLDPVVQELRQGLMPFWVAMREDGTVERCTQGEVSTYELLGYVRLGTRTPLLLKTWVWATDAQHAIKITNEHRMRLIATNAWATDAPDSNG